MAKIAEVHTFHYTNAAPQVQGFNAGDWLTIEDYILDKAQVRDKKMTILTGPCVPRSRSHLRSVRAKGGGWQIPVTYWINCGHRKAGWKDRGCRLYPRADQICRGAFRNAGLYQSAPEHRSGIAIKKPSDHHPHHRGRNGLELRAA